MLTSYRARWPMAAALSLGCVMACSDSTPIGTIECVGEHTRCGLSPEQSGYDQAPSVSQPERTISSVGIPTLAPSWSGDAFPENPYPEFSLTEDGRGHVWSLGLTHNRLRVARLDAEGVELEQHEIAPPETLRDEAHPVWLQLEERYPVHIGAIASLQWSGPCARDRRRECQAQEVLEWDRLDSPPRRVQLNDYLGIREVLSDGAHRWLINGTVTRLDAHQRVLWRQTGLLARYVQGIGDGALVSGVPVALVGSQPGGEGSSELWTLDAHGNIESRLLLEADLGSGVLVADARDRAVAISTYSEGGDLTIMRPHSDASTDGCVILREEYRDLGLDAYALDDAGAVYVITTAGGREPATWRTTLCRLDDAGDTDCHTLLHDAGRDGAESMYVDDLVVPEPGIVYVRAGARLLRYELND